MYVTLSNPPYAKLFSFVNRDGEVEITIQERNATLPMYCTLSGEEALQLAQQIEEAARLILDRPILKSALPVTRG